MNHKMTILLQKYHGKERLKHYSTSDAQAGNRCQVVFQSFFTTIFLQQDSLLVFPPFPRFCTFTGPPLLVINFYSKVFTLSLCPFFWLLGNKLVKRYGSTFSGNFNNSVEDWLKKHCNVLCSLANIVHIKRCIVGSKAIIWCVVCSHKVREFSSQAQLRTISNVYTGLQYTCTHTMQHACMVVSENDQCILARSSAVRSLVQL